MSTANEWELTPTPGTTSVLFCRATVTDDGRVLIETDEGSWSLSHIQAGALAGAIKLRTGDAT